MGKRLKCKAARYECVVPCKFRPQAQRIFSEATQASTDVPTTKKCATKFPACLRQPECTVNRKYREEEIVGGIAVDEIENDEKAGRIKAGGGCGPTFERFADAVGKSEAEALRFQLAMES